ncbi:MAG: 2-oxo acid dehydrogenase subunit E2 [Anaerolineae bacterium]|nr:2-oxo acid dehydrogenase subunit E2 [Anaerolineae bacterium]
MKTEIKMPQLGESIHEGTVSRWLKQPGDSVARYEALLEVVTDKITSEVTAPTAGTLAEIRIPEGATVTVGTILALLGTGDTRPADDDLVAVNAAARPTPRVSPLAARIAQEQGIDIASLRGSGPGGQVTKDDVLRVASSPAPTRAAISLAPPSSLADFRSPRVQALAARLGVDLSTLQGTGRDGRVTARDVERFVETRPEGERPTTDHRPPTTESAPAVEALPGDEAVPLDAMRRSIAEHMTRSQRTAPHVTTVHEADVTRMVQFFSAHQDAFRSREGFALTYTPFFVQAVVRAIGAFPQANAVFTEQGIIRRQVVNIGIAVALPEGGLLVPVIRDADEKTLVRLAREVVDLATRARARRLSPDEIRGGTFTVTNYGMFGGLIATPILHQPQAAILGVGAVRKQAVVIETPGGEAIAARSMVYLSLTFDHRAFDGALADQFVQRLVRELEDGTWHL